MCTLCALPASARARLSGRERGRALPRKALIGPLCETIFNDLVTGARVGILIDGLSPCDQSMTVG